MREQQRKNAGGEALGGLAKAARQREIAALPGQQADEVRRAVAVSARRRNAGRASGHPASLQDEPRHPSALGFRSRPRKSERVDRTHPGRRCRATARPDPARPDPASATAATSDQHRDHGAWRRRGCSWRHYRTGVLVYRFLSTPFHAPVPAEVAARAWSHLSLACCVGVRSVRLYRRPAAATSAAAARPRPTSPSALPTPTRTAAPASSPVFRSWIAGAVSRLV